MTKSYTRKVLFLAIILILLCVVGFHLLLPLLGIAIMMSAAAWGVIVGTVTVFAIVALLFFLIPGILIVLLSLFALGWAIVAIVLFPFLFPLVMPIFIILLVVALLSRRRSDKLP